MAPPPIRPAGWTCAIALAAGLLGLVLGCSAGPAANSPPDAKADSPPDRQADPPARPPGVAIVIADQAAEPERFAAEFLAERIRRDLGQTVAITPVSRPAKTAFNVYLGTPTSLPPLAKLADKLPDSPDGFLIVPAAGPGMDLAVIGRSPRATIYAAARLMRERGWRFYSVHELGEVPLDPKAAWPTQPIADAPKFAVRALHTFNLPQGIAPRYLDWMAANGLNRLVSRTAIARRRNDQLNQELARRGIEWADGPVLDAAPSLIGAPSTIKEEDFGPLGRLWSGPRVPLGAIRKQVESDLRRKSESTALLCSPARFLMDEFNWAACYFAESAWSGPLQVKPWVVDYARRYYGSRAGPDVADYFLGLESMAGALAKPDALLDDATFKRWDALRQKFYDARLKAKANTDPRKRLALYHKPLLDHYLTCAQAVRAIQQALDAPQADRAKMLAGTLDTLWKYNRRRQDRLEGFNRNDSYMPNRASPFISGEPFRDEQLLDTAQALALGDQPIEDGLIAATHAKLSAQPAAKVTSGGALAPGPGGRFVVEFAKPVRVGRVRLVCSALNPITGFRLQAQDTTGAVTTLVQAAVDSPEVFLPQEYRFPPAEVRELRLVVDQSQSAWPAAGGGTLMALEVYEK